MIFIFVNWHDNQFTSINWTKNIFNIIELKWNFGQKNVKCSINNGGHIEKQSDLYCTVCSWIKKVSGQWTEKLCETNFDFVEKEKRESVQTYTWSSNWHLSTLVLLIDVQIIMFNERSIYWWSCFIFLKDIKNINWPLEQVPWLGGWDS